MEKRNQKHELTDRPEQALESGEPKEVGRSGGKMIDDQGAAAGKGPTTDKVGDQPQHYESGRHQAGGR
jgi:hypothetical protein